MAVSPAHCTPPCASRGPAGPPPERAWGLPSSPDPGWSTACELRGPVSPQARCLLNGGTKQGSCSARKSHYCHLLQGSGPNRGHLTLSGTSRARKTPGGTSPGPTGTEWACGVPGRGDWENGVISSWIHGCLGGARNALKCTAETAPSPTDTSNGELCTSDGRLVGGVVCPENRYLRRRGSVSPRYEGKAMNSTAHDGVQPRHGNARRRLLEHRTRRREPPHTRQRDASTGRKPKGAEKSCCPPAPPCAPGQGGRSARPRPRGP